MSHTRGRSDGRQERCECGYNDLHRHLNNTILLHTLFFLKRICPNFIHKLF